MQYVNNKMIDRAFNKREEKLKKDMYLLGYEDAINNKEFGSSLEESDKGSTLEEMGMEQIVLF